MQPDGAAPGPRTPDAPQPAATGPGDPDEPDRSPVRPEPGSGLRRALGLTALGTVLPGAGLTQTRSRRIGWTTLGVPLAAVAGGAYAVLPRGVTSAALTVV